MHIFNIKKAVFIRIILLLLSSHFLFSEEPGIEALKTLFNTDNKMEIYAGIRDDIFAVFSECEEKKLPLSILFKKLQEGKNKRVKPQLLIQALRNEQEKMLKGAAIAAEIGYGADSGLKEYGKIVETICLAISGRMEENTAGFIFKKALEKKKDIDSAITVIHAIIGILAVSELSGDEVLELGESMISSQLSVSSLNSLTSFYIPGRTKRIGASEITRIICEVLKRGGGIIQIEQEIERRRANHPW